LRFYQKCQSHLARDCKIEAKWLRLESDGSSGDLDQVRISRGRSIDIARNFVETASIIFNAFKSEIDDDDDAF